MDFFVAIKKSGVQSPSVAGDIAPESLAAEGFQKVIVFSSSFILRGIPDLAMS
jgi:hypothetical protein